MLQDPGVDERTRSGNQLHSTVDLLVTALSVDDDTGERLATPEETNKAIEDARRALAAYQEAETDERTPAADVLAEALGTLLDWPKRSPADRGDFKAVLYALEMARYQYGGASQYLDPSPFGGHS